MIFTKPSLRTRVSFETGFHLLGGHAIYLGPEDIGLGGREDTKDIARVLSRYNDIIMARTFAHQDVLDLAEYGSVPVVNGLTDFNHPCQIMADIQTFEEHRGGIEGKIVTWVGDGNNVAASWLHAAVKLNFEFRIATPPELKFDQNLLDWAEREGGTVKSFTDAQKAVAGCHCVVADTWVSMGDDGERAKRLDLLAPYQVNANLMAGAKSDAIFMHCLPAHRGEEVTDDVIDGPQSVIWDEAENRLHAQKAVMAWCLGVA